MCDSQYLTEVDINKLNRAARSPDLNPIKHLWDIIGRRVSDRRVAQAMLSKLQLALQKEWQNIPQNANRNLLLTV